MPRIRDYEQQVSVGGELGGRRATAEDLGFGGAVTAFGNTMSDTASYIRAETDRREVDNAQLDMARMRNQKTEEYIQRQSQHSPGDPTFAEGVRDDVTTSLNDLRDSYSSTAAKKYIDAHGTVMTGEFFGRALVFQREESVKKTISDLENRVVLDAKTSLADPSQYSMLAKSLRFDVENGVGSYAAIQNSPRREELIREKTQQLAWAATMSMIEKPAYRAQFGAAITPSGGDFNSVSKFILKHEGSAYVASDGASGAPAKFGINQAANPNVDVKNLTKAGAVQIYKNDYWNAIGGDNLSPAMALAAMNTAVLSGVGTAKRLISESGGDANKLIDAHEQHLKRLATDPKYAPSEKGWMNRIADLRREVSNVSVEVVVDKSMMPEAYNDLSDAQQIAVMNHLKAAERQDNATAKASLNQTIADHDAHRALYGTNPPKPLKQVDFKDDVRGWETELARQKATDVVSAATKLPLSEGIAMIDKLKPTSIESTDAAFAPKAREYGEAVKLFNDRWNNITEDPIGAAKNSRFSVGQSPITDMSVGDPSKWVEELTVRVPQGRAVNDTLKLGHSTTIALTKAEARGMGQVFDQMPVGQQTALIQQLSERFKGDHKTITGFFSQVAPGNSGVAAVSTLSLLPESAAQNGELRNTTMGFILQGMKVMRPIEGKGATTEKGVQRAGMPSSSDALKVLANMSAFQEEMSPFFQMSINNQLETVMAHYVGKQTARGESRSFDLSGPNTYKNVKAFEASVLTVLGKPVAIGSTKVMTPWGMREDAFIDGVNARYRAVAPGRVSGLIPVANNPGNVYQVVEGGVAKPIFIDMDKPLPSPQVSEGVIKR